MAKGATIDIKVPQSVSNQLSTVVLQLQKVNVQLVRMTQMSAMIQSAWSGNTKVVNTMTSALAGTNAAMSSYMTGSLAASQSTSQLSSSMATAAG